MPRNIRHLWPGLSIRLRRLARLLPIGVDFRNKRHTKYGTFIIDDKLFDVIVIKTLCVKAELLQS
jgi:hypothetical protein